MLILLLINNFLEASTRSIHRSYLSKNILVIIIGHLHTLIKISQGGVGHLHSFNGNSRHSPKVRLITLTLQNCLFPQLNPILLFQLLDHGL